MKAVVNVGHGTMTADIGTHDEDYRPYAPRSGLNRAGEPVALEVHGSSMPAITLPQCLDLAHWLEIQGDAGGDR